MFREKIQTVLTGVKSSVKKNFRSATLNFLFIIAFVNVFQLVFGAENSIVGVIFAIMMSASMARDLTARPGKHLLIQMFVLGLMAAAACFVVNVNPWIALPVNLAMLFFILYAFTYEYSTHLYFPYILSYLFLVFISPIRPEQLPKRLLGMGAGAVCIILYQLFMGRKRVVETAHDVLTAIIEEAEQCVQCLLSGKGAPKNPEQIHRDLCKLSRIVYERRKRVLCVSDAGFAMIDCGRGLEDLVLRLYQMEGPVTPDREAFLGKVCLQLASYKAFVQCETPEINELCPAEYVLAGEERLGKQIYQDLLYIRIHLLKMTHPEARKKYRKTLLSFSVRMKAMLDVSPVRVVYAVRVAVLLALCTVLVQALHLPHGKWLLFTVGSVSLPYADDVGNKAKKRLLATVLGGLASVIAYALIPSSGGRTAIMMISGYISYYFSDYSATFACSTIGALGGAVFTGAFGWSDVGTLAGIRLGYICVGIAVALLMNCLFFPFRRKTASKQLWEKYESTATLLTGLCQSDRIDPQLYYSLVIQSHLLEDKLHENASAAGWDKMGELLAKCRRAVRSAHHDHAVSGFLPENSVV